MSQKKKRSFPQGGPLSQVFLALPLVVWYNMVLATSAVPRVLADDVSFHALCHAASARTDAQVAEAAFRVTVAFFADVAKCLQILKF